MVMETKSVISCQLFTPLLRSYALTCLTVFLSVFATAQTSVSYTYDAAGNRISRTIIMKALTPPPQDSTENATDDPEDTVTIAQGIENEDETPQESYNGDEMPKEIYTDVLAETQIIIYPNPTRGLLTVKISELPQHAASSLTLFDIQGRVITQKQSLADENKLDISTQPAGTYIMRIAIGEEVVSWKIIKSEL
jgi:YD repeat-containing protein